MANCFDVRMPDRDIGAVSTLGLAYLGDSVYELLVRTWLCSREGVSVKKLHARAVRHVSAPAQARAAERLLPLLTSEETSVYKRGRNARVNSVPQNANIAEYHAATGLEALFGWLYLRAENERLGELFEVIMEGSSDAT